MLDDFVSVIIVGAGPTGLAAANLLGRYGISTLLVERNRAVSDRPRAIIIDNDGLRICQSLGLADAVSRHVLLDVGAQYFSEGRLILRLPPGAHRDGYPLISTFHQPQLESTLLAGLKRFPEVQVLFEHALESFTQTPQNVLANVRTPGGAIRQIACAYLLACDGGKSLVRHLLGIPMKGMTFPQRWLVVDGFVGGDQGPGRYVSCFYNSDRPAVSIPAPHQHWHWEFMLRPDECGDLLTRAGSGDPSDALRHLLLQIGDQREPSIVRHASYTFHASYATSFAQDRVFLLGDAAHLLPPFGGQGMNSGLRDAFNLAWKIAFVLRGQARPRILETYERERMAHIVDILRFSTLLGVHLVLPTSRLRARFRNFALRAAVRMPLVFSYLRQFHGKPQPAYDHGLALRRGLGFQSAVGRLLPQPTVVLGDQRSVLLHELFGPGFALVRLHPHPTEAFEPLRSDLWRRLLPQKVCLVPALEDLRKSLENVTCAFDHERQIAQFLGARRGRFALIRPDRHLLGTFRADQELAFVAALREQALV